MWLNGSERCHDPFKWNKAYDKEASSVRISIKFILILYRIQYSGLGARIGIITCNLIGCVDDLAVNTNGRREGQTLVNSSKDLSEQKYKYLQTGLSVNGTIYITMMKSWVSHIFFLR